MRNIVLISNRLFHYRIPIYNYLFDEFRKRGFNFIVLANDIQKDSTHEIRFEHSILPFQSSLYKKELKKISPVAVILFLHLKNIIFHSLIFYLKTNKIPFINWTHGANLRQPDNQFKNAIFRTIHNLSDAIVLYSPNEKRFIGKKNYKKCFVANNTLNFKFILNPPESKQEIKRSLGIEYKKVVLFVSRIYPKKKLDDLIHVFSKDNPHGAGLVVVGPGLNEKQKLLIDKSDAITYLGEIYDNLEINRIFKMSDIFCIPGSNGLGINQAMYWGLPCIAYKNMLHGPEIYYLKDSFNGYLINEESTSALESAIFNLLSDEERLQTMSENAKTHILSEGDIHNMFLGFYNAVEYCIGDKAAH